MSWHRLTQIEEADSDWNVSLCNLIPWQLISQICKILLTKCSKNNSPGIQYIIEHFLSTTLIFLIFLFSTTLSLLHFSYTLSFLHFSQLIYFSKYIIGWRTYFNHWSTCTWLNLLSLEIGSIQPVFAIRPWYFPIHNHKYMKITNTSHLSSHWPVFFQATSWSGAYVIVWRRLSY